MVLGGLAGGDFRGGNVVRSPDCPVEREMGLSDWLRNASPPVDGFRVSPKPADFARLDDEVEKGFALSESIFGLASIV